jgi:hypothetical protein
MANKFYGAIDLVGNSDGDLDQIDNTVLSDGDGGYVITDSERIYIYHYDSGDATAANDSPRLVKPNTVGSGAGSWLITELVAQNFLMATNAEYLKGMTTLDAEEGILRISASDNTQLRAISGQSIQFVLGSTTEAYINSNGLTLTSGATITSFSIDGTLAGNSDTEVPTEKAVKTYVDTTLASGYVTLTGVQTLTNKTLTSPVLDTGLSGTAFLDEDNMASDSATKVASQQSIKAYADAITTV